MTNVSRIRTTTIRSTTDILQSLNREQLLFPAAALRICDHHLHSSGIIPRVSYDQNNNDITARIYEHDWFCVSQAVQCYPLEHSSSLLHRVVNDTEKCYCDIWVDCDSIGNSSIQFGGLVSIGYDVLALVRRIFVRMMVSPHDNDNNAKLGDDGIKKKKKSAPFSDEEKQRFREKFGFEALGIRENYKSIDIPKIRNLVRIKRPESDCLKARISELEDKEVSLSGHQKNSSLTRVTVGPQHINFGNHADHAFLAETAFHALTESSRKKILCDYVSVQYLSEVFLGDILESFDYRQQGETEEAMNIIILVATRKLTRKKKGCLDRSG